MDVQVLSLTTPGVQNLNGSQAIEPAQAASDALAIVIGTSLTRFQGLATLPTPAPEKAVQELERSVTKLGLQGAMLYGRTGSANLDEAKFWPIFEAASHFRCPLYLHPQTQSACLPVFGQKRRNVWSGRISISGGKHIDLPAREAKGRKRRIIPMEPNLIEWLTPYRPASGEGKIVENFRWKFQAFAKAVNYSPWPKDCLRHSYASYHLAKFQNSGKTAEYMGHRSTQMLYDRYREVIKEPTDIEAYWKQVPESAKTGTIPLLSLQDSSKSLEF